MKLKTKLEQYLSDTSGNVAMLTVIALPIMLMMIGATVTVNEVHTKRARLQIHADIMSLEMAKRRSEFQKAGFGARAYFGEYMNAEMRPDDDCKFKFTGRNPAKAEVTCTGKIDTFLAGFLDDKTVSYSASSTATTATTNIFEVAFVFDVSLSMNGQEIEDLKDGLGKVTESRLFDDVNSRLSLIPFSNTVRLGPEFEQFVTPGTGYAAAGGVYNGCFDRNATDPNVNLKFFPTFPLVRNVLDSGKVVCQDEKMTAIFHRESSDWDVKDLQNNIETSFGTGMSDALVWGFRSLDPALRGIMSSEQQYPLAIGQSSKNIIMMTDGRPYDRPWTGPAGGDVTVQNSLDRLRDVCAQLPFETNNINFHLINYNNNALSDEHIEVFNECVRGEGEYHNVANGNLASVLEKITYEISSLRISE